MRSILITLIILVALIIFPTKALAKEIYWNLQSIDTMKYSRDLAREKENDLTFDKLISSQIEKIKDAGATHVAIATPYDDEFIPFLKKWVSVARENELNVWFRGNFSGWEQWFGYEKISRDEHLEKTDRFIRQNPDLFENGDVFTSCTECENGGPGDPRDTGDVKGHRNFLINSYQVSKKAFSKIGKEVASNYFSMNGDVAYLIMDKKTTEALGGIVVIDHYVAEPVKLAEDIRKIAERSGGVIVLGEFGAPIPDIHGTMTEYEQTLWIDNALSELSNVSELTGINYWTGFGGTTNIWRADGTQRSSVEVIAGYFKPKEISGRVINELGRGVKDAKVSTSGRLVKTDKNGEFTLLVVPSQDLLTINAKSYNQYTVNIDEEGFSEIILFKSRENIFFKIAKVIYNFFRWKT